MRKHTIAAVILCAGAAIGVATPAHAADIFANTAPYDSTDGYDYVSALSEYYPGYSGNEKAVQIELCDSYAANCTSNQNGPANWSVTWTQVELADLTPALSGGSIDFGYTWDASPPAQPIPDIFTGGYFPQYVYAGAGTLDITAFRRFHKL